EEGILDEATEQKWNKLLKFRSEITRALETARREKKIGHPLEAEVFISVPDTWNTFLENQWQTLQEISIVSSLVSFYQAIRVGGDIWILAKERVRPVMEEVGVDSYSVVAEFEASILERRTCVNPLTGGSSLVVLADYVTTDAGTGCVHTAPGHGVDDYQTGLRYDLEILSPIDDEGFYTAEAGPYAGQKVPDVNDAICSKLDELGALVKKIAIQHSYPHCWRCKEPVMYRATPQWFISMEKNELRQKALGAIDRVAWVPSWGRQRIYEMVANRPDWCLSRQRSWGVPITVISCSDCGAIVKDDALNERIDHFFRKEGADAWFTHDVETFLAKDYICSECGAKSFRKENDILDVWFDSGTSHAAVLEQRKELGWPADLYLEGSDQHRGWFNSSLLTSVGTRGTAPFRSVLTHGYVVDGKGMKMSKSVGNVVAPQEVINKYGAEILRLWVASEDYRGDVKVSEEILKQVSDSY
ncbi:unnamed protein product, partial [Cyprideis torosa]